MSDTERTIRKVWDAEDRKKPRAADGGLGHDELRDRWLERYPHMAYSGGDWYAYGDGFWRQVDVIAVERQVMDVLEGSREEGVKVTGHLLGSVMRLARAATFVPPEMWDASPDALVLANGTLEVSTQTLRGHKPEDYAKARLPYEYDPEATADVFLAVLKKAIPWGVEFLQEFAGYCLTPDTSLETALWFKGPRGCGKSTIIEGLMAMLGPRHGILGLAEIESSPFALQKIPGRTLLTSTEQPASYLKSTHVIDALVSGETLIVNRKYRDAEEVKPVAKVIWAMNDLPRIANTTSGIFRRVKVLEFPKLRGQAEPEVKEYVKQEGAGILNWALDGLERLQERGHFKVPVEVQGATEEFERSNDLPMMFVEEECITGAGHEVASRLLYSRYREWCVDNGHKPQSSTRLADDWRRLGFERRRVKGRSFWSGVALRTGSEV
jgi:putative DNA primase/helicase